MQLLDYVLHLDRYLNQWAGELGAWTYLLLFIIVFCETGLVVTPFLPGDSLLFAVGALAATDGSPIDVVTVMAVLCAAAVLGDAVNYSIGRRLGPKVFRREDSILLNKKHLERTRAFYEKHGGKTIVLARFIPIIRTFAPFVAGIGKMKYPRFALYNVTGAVAWVIGVTLLGYFFGNIPIVKESCAFVLVAIVVISLLPVGIELLRARRAGKAEEGNHHGDTEARREEGEEEGERIGSGSGRGSG